MNKISCIIIEDEIPAAEELKFILSKYDFIDIKATAHDGESGLNLITHINPKVVFLDINIPLKNGMELAKEIRNLNKDIDIIFVTACEQHALQAFELNALDYILKPFDDSRIDLTIKRLKSKWSSQSSTAKIPEVINELMDKLDKKEDCVKKIPCENFGKIILIDIKDVYFCYTENEKVYVKTKESKYLTTYNMNKLQDRTNFFRAHRGYLVNLDNIRELYSWFNGTYKLVMDDKENSEVPISRSNVKKLKELLGI